MEKQMSKKYECFNCGKTFAKRYEEMLHMDFHKGEPVVRAAGCFCGADYDIRNGKCAKCGHIHSAGWVVA
jgi:DNA-directed RNA polymerase subunit RPC12/RpoP